MVQAEGAEMKECNLGSAGNTIDDSLLSPFCQFQKYPLQFSKAGKRLEKASFISTATSLNLTRAAHAITCTGPASER
jgi:hypothetical protein